MDYKKLLDDGFTQEQISDTATSRLEYLSEQIFNFVTYDSEMAELFATKAIEVCKVISDRKTFDYIFDKENYQWFLIMCNMPFFAERTEWGTSVRGAWWSASSFSSCGLWLENKQITDEIQFSADEWLQFIGAVIEFSNEA